MQLSYSDHPEFDAHEHVEFFEDTQTGLRGILAIHSTKLGPAVGGTRYYHYSTEAEALDDVLRLSKAMSYKCALAGVPFGGGKCVLIAPEGTPPKTSEYLKAYGSQLKKFDTTFFTGEDVGMSQQDIETIAEVTTNIIGTRAKAGDPSPFAAQSVYYSMRGALRFVNGSESFKNKKIAIKGLGKVGMELARLLDAEGAELIVADISASSCEDALARFSRVIVASPEDIHTYEVDVFAPCALGREITPENVGQISAKIVCGSANNQLASPEQGESLFRSGIVYVPDYIANAGGLINVVAELGEIGYNETSVLEKCKGLENTVYLLLSESKSADIATNIMADNRAREILGK